MDLKDIANLAEQPAVGSLQRMDSAHAMLGQLQGTSLSPALAALSMNSYLADVERLEKVRAVMTDDGLERARRVVGLDYLERAQAVLGDSAFDHVRRELDRLDPVRKLMDQLSSTQRWYYEWRQTLDELGTWGLVDPWFTRGGRDQRWLAKRADYWALLHNQVLSSLSARVAEFAGRVNTGPRTGPPRIHKFEIFPKLELTLGSILRVMVGFVQSLQTDLMRRNLFGARFGASIEPVRG